MSFNKYRCKSIITKTLIIDTEQMNKQLTSKLFASYSFMAVMHWCRVLMLEDTPLFSMVSVPEGGLNGMVVPAAAVAPPPNVKPPPRNKKVNY